MKLKAILIAPVLILPFLYNCAFEPYDVNTRFEESSKLSTPTDVAIADTNNFSFVHVTDIHVENGVNNKLSSMSDHLIGSDEFIVISGDLVDTGKRSDTIAYRDIMDNLGLPYYSAPGNHDFWNNGWDGFKDVLGPSVYTAVVGDLLIIVLDSADDTLGSLQYAWLEKQLKQRTEKYCIVVSHYNLHSPTMFESAQSTNMEEVYGMMRLFKRHDVDYVVMGHTHIFDYRKIDGVSYLVGDELKKYSSNGTKYYNRITVTNGLFSHEKIPIK
ncbi:MAG: metallophosphoesterase [Leptospirales bacterium]